MNEKPNLYSLPSLVLDKILLETSGGTLHNLRQVNHKLNDHIKNSFWERSDNRKECNRKLERNWRQPNQTVFEKSYKLSAAYVNCDLQDLCVTDCSSKFALLRTFYDTELKDSRILVYDLKNYIMSELQDVNDSYVDKALGSNFEAKITDKLLVIRIYLRKVDSESGTFYTNIRVWNLETNRKVFDSDIKDLENYAVGNYNNPYLVALFCKTPEILDFKDEAVLRFGVNPEGGYGDNYFCFLFDKFFFSPILIKKVINYIFLIFPQFSCFFLLWKSVICSKSSIICLLMKE